MGRLKQPQKMIGIGRVNGIKLVTIPDKMAISGGSGPLCGQVSTIDTRTISAVLRVCHRLRDKAAPSSTHGNFDAVTVRVVSSKFDKLTGYVGTSSGVDYHVTVAIVLIVSLHTMGIVGRWRGVGDARSCHYPSCQSAHFRSLEKGQQMVTGLTPAVAPDYILVNTDDAGLGLNAGRHGGHGAGGIGNLLVGVVGFG